MRQLFGPKSEQPKPEAVADFVEKAQELADNVTAATPGPTIHNITLDPVPPSPPGPEFPTISVFDFDWSKKRRLVKASSITRNCQQYTSMEDLDSRARILLLPEGKRDKWWAVRDCRTCHHLYIPFRPVDPYCPKCQLARQIAKPTSIKAVQSEAAKLMQWLEQNAQEQWKPGERPDVEQSFDFGGFGQIHCTPRVRRLAQLLALGSPHILAAYLSGIPVSTATELVDGNAHPRRFKEIWSYYSHRYIASQYLAEIHAIEKQLSEDKWIGKKGEELKHIPTTERGALMERKAKFQDRYLECQPPEPEQLASAGGMDEILPPGSSVREAGEKMLE